MCVERTKQGYFIVPSLAQVLQNVTKMTLQNFEKGGTDIQRGILYAIFHFLSISLLSISLVQKRRHFVLGFGENHQNEGGWLGCLAISGDH